MMSIVRGDILSSSFDARHAAYMTGASIDQLYRWRREGIIHTEYDDPGWGYSFRDLVEIRLAAYVRASHPMAEVRKYREYMPDVPKEAIIEAMEMMREINAL